MATTATTERLVTADEVGKAVGVQSATIKSWASDGIIPAVRINKKIVRYSIPKVIAALEARAERASR